MERSRSIVCDMKNVGSKVHLFFRLKLNPTVALAIALMSIIVMMILPVPAFVLDLGLVASFALAILIFTSALFVERPLDFSSFPTVLLASLMLRLSLNVSSTKLIISEGHTGTHAAGGVIEGFANFVMSGNAFLGIVVFCVLLIVNFMVITKGATRMAEVGARFALDAMPGRQLAIDSDMSAGAIDHAEAKARRETDQQETTFFGSLDGASKFVKGDAVAGLLITLLNLVVGLIMGLVVHGMPIGKAIETYSILTVGDGLVSQIPAVIISIAAALLLARGGAKGSSDVALFDQLSQYPAALTTVGVMLVGFSLVPGLPFVPFVLAGAILCAVAWSVSRNKEKATELGPVLEAPENTLQEAPLADILDLDEIHIEFSTNLIELVVDPAVGLDARISNMRKHLAKQFGVIMPEIRLTDEAELPAGQYRINLHGVALAKGMLHPEKVLLLLGQVDAPMIPGDVSEPVYGAPARWIDSHKKETYELDGGTVVHPSEVLSTHILEVLKRNLARILTFKSLQRLLDEMVNLSSDTRAAANRRLLDELIPEKVPLDLLHAVLKLLLEEQVSIRNLPLIMETIAKVHIQPANPEAVCEIVRQAIGFQIVAPLRREDGSIPLIQLSPEWEAKFEDFQVSSLDLNNNIALPPETYGKLVNAIANHVSKATENGEDPALVTAANRRRFLKTAIRARGLQTSVLSYEEIGLEAVPAMIGVVAA